MLRNLKSFNLPELEEKVLAFWKEKHIFEKSVKKGSKTFRFWEGPPTANGRPGLHHVLARSFKDVVLRYKTMQGFLVPRKAGWDTHGLPVELQVEKQLGLKSKKDIEHYGIAEFNKKCKESVWQYKSEWEKLTERMGYWLDLEHPYVTYENSYVEALWGVIKKIYDRKLLYQGHKVVPWCPRCGTALSSHELAQGYKTVTDESVFVKFRIEKPFFAEATKGTKAPVCVLSWTTTPWTLPGNVALAVGKDIAYGLFRNIKTEEYVIVAVDRAEVLGKGFEKVESFKGRKLEGLSYKPLFDVPALKSDASYKVYAADFVTAQDGTGIVHTAVMYGEDDYELGKKIGLPQYHTVDEQGKFTKDVKGLSGMFVKSSETEKKIFELLQKNKNLFKTESYEHEYPHCWRCGTPLLYYARGSWFVAMSKLRSKLQASNAKINWIPSHLQKGRFGEWLKDVKDWNFSRERYWGTPLPVWKCDSCGHTDVIGSFVELSKKADKGNTFFIMRHGQATSNVEGWLAGGKEPKSGKFRSKLTKTGIEQVGRAAQELKKKKIDIIYTSPYCRTIQTARIISGVTGAKVIFDKRLGEINSGIFNHKKVTERLKFYALDGREEIDKFSVAPEGGETLSQVRERVLDFFTKIAAEHRNQSVLIVSHGDTMWMLQSALEHFSNEQSLEHSFDMLLKNAELKKLSYDNLPTDMSGRLDPHRPYVDEIEVRCEKCVMRDEKSEVGKMKRIPEVADVWFDSGAMPVAQEHSSFAQIRNLRGIYPADYICEAIDQTRGWFYTLLAVATLLDVPPPPYRNVISVGLIHDKQGQKMSKSKGNVVDPWALMQKYGADAVRWYFFTVNDPGESKNFDEQDVVKTLRRFHMVAYNSYAFLSMYGKKGVSLSKPPSPSHILDAWILERLTQTTQLVVQHMDAYDVTRAALVLEAFTDDLSRWYIRRSRKRISNESATLAYVLLQYAKLIAPFSPFFAEGLFQSLKKDFKGVPEESVHLSRLDFPTSNFQLPTSHLMQWVRDTASAVLAKRAELGIKVRQPLAKLTVKNIPKAKRGSRVEEMLEVLKEEINVKDVVMDAKLGSEFELDIEITPELKAEGLLREFVRTVQGLRQDAGYQPKDRIQLWVAGSEQIELLVKNNEKELMRQVGAKKMMIGKNDKVDAQVETKVDEYRTWIGVRKK